MALDTQDKKYIDSSIDKALVKARRDFRDEMEPFFNGLMRENRDHMTALIEDSDQKFKALVELIQDRPTRNEVKDLISQSEERTNVRLTNIEVDIGI